MNRFGVLYTGFTFFAGFLVAAVLFSAHSQFPERQNAPAASVTGWPRRKLRNASVKRRGLDPSPLDAFPATQYLPWPDFRFVDCSRDQLISQAEGEWYMEGVFKGIPNKALESALEAFHTILASNLADAVKEALACSARVTTCIDECEQAPDFGPCFTAECQNGAAWSVCTDQTECCSHLQMVDWKVFACMFNPDVAMDMPWLRCSDYAQYCPEITTVGEYVLNYQMMEDQNQGGNDGGMGGRGRRMLNYQGLSGSKLEDDGQCDEDDFQEADERMMMFVMRRFAEVKEDTGGNVREATLNQQEWRQAAMKFTVDRSSTMSRRVLQEGLIY